jgi:UDP-glucose 4-epimerase
MIHEDGLNVKPCIVVTGGCGFVGRPLTRHLLAAGYDVIVVDDLSKGAPDPGLTAGVPAARLVIGSILDQELVSDVFAHVQPVAVVHLAAMHFIPDCDREPDRCVQVNVAGTHNVLRSAAALPVVPAFILASTAAVYAPSMRAHAEGDQLEPMDIYGLTKLWCEHLVRLFHAQHGLPAIVARLFNVYGPGETSPHLIPSLIVQADRSPRDILVGDLSTRRDYVYVDDVARAIVAMVLARRGGRGLATCNVGSGQDRSGQEVLDALAKTMRTNLRVVPDSQRVRVVDRPRLLASVAFAHELFGWMPSTSFEEGLAAAVQRPYAASATRAAELR